MPKVEITQEFMDGDIHVVGLEADGSLIFYDVNARPDQCYTSGEGIAEWGLENFTGAEVARLLSLEGIRPQDRRLLEQ